MSKQDCSKPRRFYVYVLLDTRRPGCYEYGDYSFEYEPFYIGKGSGKRHASTNSWRGKPQHKHIRLDEIRAEGYKAKGRYVKRRILETTAFRLERKLIQLIGRLNRGTGPLTNMSDGGAGTSGMVVTAATREKISAANKGRKPEQWHIERVREANLGRKHSEATKKKMSEMRKGKPKSEEWRRKISDAHKGRKFTDAHRKALSKSHKGYEMPQSQKDKIQKSMLTYRANQ